MTNLSKSKWQAMILAFLLIFSSTTPLLTSCITDADEPIFQTGDKDDDNAGDEDGDGSEDGDNSGDQEGDGDNTGDGEGEGDGSGDGDNSGDDNTGEEPGDDNGDNSGDDGTDTGDTAITTNIKNLTLNQNLTATAVVTAQSTRGLILTDNGGSILYYNQNINLSDYPINTVVKVNGTVGQYNRGYQLDDKATIQKVGTEVYMYPQPTQYTASMVDNACAGASTDYFQPTYVSIEGTLNISNNYYNIVIEGATAQGSLYYVIDSIKNEIATGEKYKFTGYFNGVSGGTKFFNIVATAVEKVNSSSGGSDNSGSSSGSMDTNGIPSVFSSEPLGYVILPTSVPSQLKSYTGFNLSFNKDNHTPNYVSWELTSAEASSNNAATARNYWVDNSLEGCLSTDYAYSSTSMQRGHMCPAADQKWSKAAMDDAAVMANMCPQLASLNEKMWATLEGKERDFAKKYGKIMIVCGPIYSSTDTQYVGAAKARVAGQFFKAFLYNNGSNYQAIAYVFNHGTNPGNYNDYAMTIDDLEKLTGYDFFSALPDDIETQVESTMNKSFWQ